MADILNLADLDGSNGFTINGINEYDRLGFSVNGAGDVNDDGIDDFIIGAPYIAGPPSDNGAEQTYVIFGSEEGFDANLSPTDLNGSNGFIFNSLEQRSGLGRSVSGAGDINGDGIDDLIIGATPVAGAPGRGYAIFGSEEGFDANLSPTDLDGSNGFIIDGVEGSDLGFSVSGTGDINGDGIDDFIIGASSGNIGGQSYIIFGSNEGFDANLSPTDLDGSNGFVVNGFERSGLGRAVSGAGDINGDGFADIIIGASAADPNGSNSGQSYVIFGSNGGFDASLSPTDLNGSNGFVLNGINENDGSGSSVGGAGDINGDGFADIIIGAPKADPNGSDSGQSYVVFGSDTGFDASLELSSLDGSNGLVLNGINLLDGSGSFVSGAGDVNGDGLDDIIIGASGVDGSPVGTPSSSSSGQSYVVFGSDTGFEASLELSSLDGSNGLVLNGINENDRSGSSVGGAGDINGDGFADIIIGAPEADPNNLLSSGQSYVVFGFDTNDSTPPPPSGTPIFGTLEEDRLNIVEDSVIVFAGEGDDLVDASQSLGSNRIFGGAGNDDLFASHNDQLFGEAGEDILNATVGSGNNRLYGGDEDDILFAGVRDSLFGGGGDDIIFAGDGENLLNGAQGADQFWIANAALPSSPNRITDFELDTDVLGIGGLGLNFDDLSLFQQGNDALITALDRDLIILSGIQASDLNSNNFVFA